MPLARVCAITCDCYPADPLVRRTAEAAARAGHEYHVICSQDVGQSPYEVYNGVHIHRIYMPGGHGKPLGRITANPLGRTVLLWSTFMLLAGFRVARLHLSHKFDVIHVHNFPDFLVFAALIPKVLGAKVILHVQDLAPELAAVKIKGAFRNIVFRLSKLEERASTKFADHVITVGRPFEPPLLKRGVPLRKLSVVLNSADPHTFTAERRTEPFLGVARADRPLVLMYHGTFAERCGLDVALSAFARARTRAPHLRLHFMGAGESAARLKQLVQHLEISDNVSFLPMGPVESVPKFITDGDIGIIPYRSDGFMDLLLPTKAYEFAWMHRPMIASDLMGIRSMFRPESVLLCKPSDVDSFADAIVDLYEHPEKRAEMVANAATDYEKFRWELSAEKYQQVLASLVQKKATHQADLQRVA